MTNDLDQAVIVAIGGNLAGAYPSCGALLEAALTALSARGVGIAARSGWWRSAAWPDPDDPPFLNAVAIVETTLAPEALLHELKAVEAAFGRQEGARNTPRTVDLDMIAYGRRVIEAPGLSLPHPRAHERLFVMGPLAEIAPGWRHPVLGRTARDLARTATVGADARPEATT